MFNMLWRVWNEHVGWNSMKNKWWQWWCGFSNDFQVYTSIWHIDIDLFLYIYIYIHTWLCDSSPLHTLKLCGQASPCCCSRQENTAKNERRAAVKLCSGEQSMLHCGCSWTRGISLWRGSLVRRTMGWRHYNITIKPSFWGYFSGTFASFLID